MRASLILGIMQRVNRGRTKGPRLSRRGLRALAPERSSLEELRKAADAAIAADDLPTAARLLEAAYRRRPDPEVAALGVWVRFLWRTRWRSRPRASESEVAELRAIAEAAPESARVRGLLIRSLITRGELGEARRLLDAMPEALRREHAVRRAEAVLLVGEGKAREGLALLRELRCDDPSWVPWLTFELCVAASERDEARVLEAHAARCVLESRRPRPVLVRLWFHGGALVSPGYVLWGLGILTRQLWLSALGVGLVLAAHLLFRWVLRPRRAILLTQAATLAYVLLLTWWAEVGTMPRSLIGPLVMFMGVGCCMRCRRALSRRREAALR